MRRNPAGERCACISAPLLWRSLRPGHRSEVSVSDTATVYLRDVVIESVNARDPDLLDLADEVVIRNGMGDRLAQILDYWPGALLTRGELRGRAVAAVWLPDGDGCYVRMGHLEFQIENGHADMLIVAEHSFAVEAEAPVGREVTQRSRRLEDSWVDWVDLITSRFRIRLSQQYGG
jgi:hypothetical protein